MSVVTPYIVTAILATGLLVYWSKWRIATRTEFIRQYSFPKGLFEKLQRKRPNLTLKDCQLVALGLRQFFLTYAKSKCQPVSMPSQVADDLWHELILYTKAYELFCNRAFGRFMHHTPAVVLSTARDHNAGLRRCWWYACREESINPRKATRLPLLFALDAKLNIDDGFRYKLDCNLKGRRDEDGRVVYCGGDFGVSCFDGGADGSGYSFEFDGDSSCSGDSGCSGGCGGD